MMRVVALMLLIAGCSGPSPVETEQDEPCIVEAADDYSCDAVDGNKTADQVAHLHDYWRGQDTVRLLDADQDMGRPTYSSCDPYPVVQFLPGDDATVHQGAGRMDIAMRFQPAGDHRAGQGELWIRSADKDHAEYVADLEDGATVTINVPYNASDLPHQVLSAWEFTIYFRPDPVLSNVQCFLLPRGTVGLTVDIHRTLDLVPFPGHPDHWANGTQLPILDAYAEFNLVDGGDGYCSTSSDASHPEGSCQMHWSGFGPQGGLIVPPGAGMVRLTLQADPDPGHEDVELILGFHGADTRTMETAQPVERTANTAIYEIDPRGRTDGPYAQQSQWAFQVGMETPSGFYGGGWSLEGTVLPDG